MNEQLETINGRVAFITYQNQQNGYTVFTVTSNSEDIVCVGNFPYITVGDSVTLTGCFVVHQTYGEQFKAISCEKETPSTAAAILRYLSSGTLKGIGPSTAAKIVRKFGNDTLEIIKNEPNRLSEIKGISLEKAIKVSEQYRLQAGLQDAMLFLSQYKISPEHTARIFKVFGNNTIDVVSNNPYALCCEEIGFSFERADELALMFDIPQNSQNRIAAGIQYILRHNLQNGHTCLPKTKVIQTANVLLECSAGDIEDVADKLLTHGELNLYTTQETEFLMLPRFYAAEEYIANRLFLLINYAKRCHLDELEINYIENKLHIKYDDMQRKAIHTAFSGGVFVLTGGPGTGKTTTLNGLIELFENKDLKVLLAAPTGRAAQRMEELTKREAKTLHRLLEVQWSEGDRPYFERNERNQLNCDVIIVDEMSMVDSLIFESLLRAVKIGTKIILVGDSDQLPSVSAGNVLHDIIASKHIPFIKLKKIFRQSEKSLIVRNAHSIIAGEMPFLNSRDADFFMIDNTSSVDTLDTVVSLCTERLPKAYGFSPISDIQVLCPSRKFDLGSVALNVALQAKLNPYNSTLDKQLTYNGFSYRANDKVMQIKNNYDIGWVKDDGESGTGVFNGDIGIVESLDAYSQILSVRYCDKVVTYYGADLAELEPAYAVTVHKSQGSEFECVILPLYSVPSQLTYRNLLYTAVTRAKRLLIIVGDRNCVAKMVENDRKTLRYSALKGMIKEVFCEHD